MRLLVCGGASIVGARLCERLLEGGHEVLAADDLSSGTYGNVAHLARMERFAFVEHDVATPFRADVDAVFDLAFPATHELDVARAAVTCVAGTKNALDASVRVVMATPLGRFADATSLALACAEALGISRGARVVRVPLLLGPGLPPDGQDVLVRTCLAWLHGGSASIGSDMAEPVRAAWIDDVVRVLLDALHDAQEGGGSPVRVPPYFEVTSSEIVAALRGETVEGRPPDSREAPSVSFVEAMGETLASFAARMGLRPVRRGSGVFRRRTRRTVSVA